MRALMLYIVFQALLEKYTNSMAACMTPLLTQSETLAASFLLVRANALGNAPFCPAAMGISAQSMVHASHPASTETIRPASINQLPHGDPTACSRTPEVHGLATW